LQQSTAKIHVLSHPSEEQIAGQGPGDASTAHRVQLDQSGPPCRIRPNATPSKKLLWAMTTGVDHHAELGTHDGKMMNEFPRVRIGSRDSGRRSTAMAAAGTDLI